MEFVNLGRKSGAKRFLPLAVIMIWSLH